MGPWNSEMNQLIAGIIYLYVFPIFSIINEKYVFIILTRFLEESMHILTEAFISPFSCPTEEFTKNFQMF